MQVKDFESATDFVNQSLQLINSPLKALEPDITVRPGNIIKFILVIS